MNVTYTLKNGSFSLHKNILGKNYQQKTLNDRIDNFNTIRKKTRNSLLYLKRQIDENLSPINTPEPTKVVKKVIEKQKAKKPNKKPELLYKWKADKEKRRREDREKAKPIFKVCHIPVEVGLPDLEKVYNEIKGKRIKSVPVSIKSQFAPPNDKFHAPKNIKPINIIDRSSNSLAKIKIETQKSGSSTETSKINSTQNPITQRNTRSATNRKEQISKLNDNVGSTSSKASQKKIEENKNNPKQQKSVPVDLVKSKIKNLPSKNMPNINIVDLTTVVREVNSLPKNKQTVNRKEDTKIGADYFTKKLNNEIARIERMCDEWSKYKDDNNCPDEAKDMIDVAIGQSKLLISKKFQLFQDLINQCESFQFKEKLLTWEDLHGFWDMVYMQVEHLNKKFNSLDNLKTNNWREVLPEKKTVIKRGIGRPKKATASSSLKSLMEAACNMKKSDDGNTLIPLQPDETVFSGGYDIIKSPIRDQKLLTPRSSSTRKSKRVSLSANRVKTRVSLTMMKISQATKCGDGLTPSKSISKTDLTKSANRITKSVFFKDDLENKVERRVQSLQSMLFKNVEDRENDSNEINLISFSPVTSTRRSRRLTDIS